MRRKLPSVKAENQLKILGENLNIARRQRRMTIKESAIAASLSPLTISRLEKGDQGTSIGALAMYLTALGEVHELGQILSPEKDILGLSMTINNLPKRIQRKRKKNVSTNMEIGTYDEETGLMSF